MKVAVYIATTEGPVRITHLQPDSGDLSVMLLTGTSDEVPISARKEYQRFVHGNTGAIERVLGRKGTFRMEVSGPIDGGESWQLGAFLAHALLGRGRLAQGVDPDTESVDDIAQAVIVTGTVNPTNRSVGAVNHVAKKIEVAGRVLRTLTDQGVDIGLIVPIKNQAEANTAASNFPLGAEVWAAASVDEVCERLEISLDPIAVPGKKPLWAATTATIAALGALAAFWAMNVDGSDPPVIVETAPPTIALPGPVDPIVPDAAARESARIQLAELRPPDGVTCAAVHLGQTAPLRSVIPEMGNERVASSSHNRTLCGIEFTVDIPQQAFAFAFFDMDHGDFADCDAMPSELYGIVAFSGARSWSCNIPALFAPLAYRLVMVSGPEPVADIVQQIRGLADRSVAIDAMERDGVTFREIPHAITP